MGHSNSKKLSNEEEIIFHQSAANGELKTLQELIQKVNINAKDTERKTTAIYKASTNGHLDVVQYLFNNGAKLMGKKNAFKKYDQFTLN